MRSLTYSESLSRVSMFLSVLAGAVIALALVAQADRFGQTFVLIAILVLSVVLFIGVATVVRLEVLNHDDLRWVMGMNRIRHAYLERHPELEPYFVTTKHDDFIGVSTTLGYERTPTRGIGQLAHGMQTLPVVVGRTPIATPDHRRENRLKERPHVLGHLTGKISQLHALLLPLCFLDPVRITQGGGFVSQTLGLLYPAIASTSLGSAQILRGE